MTVVLLHPGAMGASIGAALVRPDGRGTSLPMGGSSAGAKPLRRMSLTSNGHDVTWVSAGRSEATRERAERAGLEEAEHLSEALADAEIAFSVCPPEAAVELATQVADTGFEGIYVDANAVSPATARRIEGLHGERLVDGGIIGPPAWRPGVTRMYLSGPQAETVAALFEGTLVDARAIDGGVGAASALKMCYAAFTKGSSALLLGIRALAKSNGVTDQLLAEWDVSQAGLGARSAGTAKSTSPKAWRFEGEMLEIASTFAEAGLPDQFHKAAAEIYSRMAGLKHVEGGADLDTVIGALLQRHDTE